MPLTFELLVHHLGPEPEPPGVDLGVDELEFRMPLEHAGEGELGERCHAREEPLDHPRDVHPRCIVGHGGRRGRRLPSPHGAMDAHGDRSLRGRCPERLIGAVPVRQHAEVRDEHALGALGHHPGELAEEHLDAVVNRDQGQADQPLRVDGAELVEQPVVVGTQHRQSERSVVEHVGHQRGHGVDGGGIDAVEVHVLQMGGPVVVPGEDLVEGQPAGLVLLDRATSDRVESEGRPRRLAVEAPAVAAVRPTKDARRTLAVLGGQIGGECVRWLNDVVVRRDHPVFHGSSSTFSSSGPL